MKIVRCLLLFALAASSSWAQELPGTSLKSSDPLDGSILTTPPTQIMLDFVDPVDTSGVIVTRDYSAIVSGTLSHGPDSNILIFTPTQSFADGFYTVDFQAVRMPTGGAVTGVTSISFTLDATPPSLVSSIPSAGQSGVAVDSTITLNFSEPLAQGATPFVLTGPTGIVPLVYVPFDSNSTFTYAPVTPLSLGTTYTVDYSTAIDQIGHAPLPPASFTFTTQLPPVLTLVSGSPADGQQGIPTDQSLTFTFNNDIDLLASAISVRNKLETVHGTLVATGPTAGFFPNEPLKAGVEYIVDLSGIRDIYSQSPAGQTSLTFTTLGGTLVGFADPQMVTLSAGERVGITYLFRSSSEQEMTVLSPTVDYIVNGQVIGSAVVPVRTVISGSGVTTVATDVSISEQIQNLVLDAGTDQVVLMRTFTSQDASQTTVSIPLVVRLGGNLAGPASVTEIVLDVPTDSKTVGQFEELKGRAFVRGTGSGALTGTWFVDGQPTESFQINLVAGMPQQVSTRLSLPTHELGQHAVELRITRPHEVSSGSRVYVVVPEGTGSQRVFLLGSSSALLSPDAPRTSFRWIPMPGASGYEIAFAPTAKALGFGDSIVKSAWTDAMVKSGSLLLLARVPADVLAWTPTASQHKRLFEVQDNKIYWAVRAVYSTEAYGDPATTSRPRMATLETIPSSLGLIAPDEGELITTMLPTFSWETGPQGVLYEFAITSEDRPVFTALTKTTRFTLNRLAGFRLSNGDYTWRVSALHPSKGVVASSEHRAFSVKLTVESETQTSRKPESMLARSMLIASAGDVPALASGITMSPPNGAVVDDPQPLITAQYAELKPVGALLTLNGVDVTDLANITEEGLELAAPGVFSEGEHAVVVLLETSDGKQYQAESKFTITAKASETADAAQGPDDSRPLHIDFNWNWAALQEGEDEGSLAIDVNLRGGQTWIWQNDSYAAFSFQVTRPSGQSIDVANLLAQMSVRADAYKFTAGDVGSSESELTAQGLMHRSFNFVSNAGPIRLSAWRTLGQNLQSSNVGRAPDMLLVTAEPAGSTAQRGLKLTFLDSECDLSGMESGFGGATRSRVFSLAGRTPLAKTGLNLRAELARSDATVSSPFGTSENTGNAVIAALDGTYAGMELTTSYRRIDNEYLSPASNTLTNDIESLTFGAKRKLGDFVSAGLTYASHNSMGNSGTPRASMTSSALDLTMAFPRLPSLTLRVAQNEADSAPLFEGGRPQDTEEQVISAALNYSTDKLNSYFTYSRSTYDDFFDFVDPAIDTPNDRRTGTWTAGLLAQVTEAFRLRCDFGSNSTDRWFRNLLLGDEPSLGGDDSKDARIQAEYRINPRLSATATWAHSEFSDALGQFGRDYSDFSARMNYFLRLGPSGAGIILTGEYRRAKLTSLGSEDRRSGFNLFINDNRMLRF